VQHVQPEDIIVLTPFRAQRALVRQFLDNAGLKRVAVSTVHRAQGSERHTVIFDPVQGDSPFLKNEDTGPRLINVAISRAKARLIIVLSPGDRRSPLLEQIYRAVQGPKTAENAIPISIFIKQPGFPSNAIGKLVKIGPFVGIVSEVLDVGAKFKLHDSLNGAVKVFSTQAVKDNFA
jgi:hypothetical protein